MQVGVSLVLSFFFVWDMPTIAKGMQTLRTSRFRAIYNEVAPTFAVFGALFGKALQAQVWSFCFHVLHKAADVLCIVSKTSWSSRSSTEHGVELHTTRHDVVAGAAPKFSKATCEVAGLYKLVYNGCAHLYRLLCCAHRRQLGLFL